MSTLAEFTTLFLGDLNGSPGYLAALERLPGLRDRFRANLVVVNAENAAEDGLGLLPEQFHALRQAGVDVVTTGNHVWEKPALAETLAQEPRLLRPDNYSRRLPGRGWCVVEAAGFRVFVANLQGRWRMNPTDDPFDRAEALLEAHASGIALRFFDFHAEESDEKEAFAYALDGRATAVVGTHTHVATADERLLPQGTAYQTDLGMCGPEPSVIGSDPGPSIERALTMLPLRSQMASGPAVLRGLVVRADPISGRARSVERVLS